MSTRINVQTLVERANARVTALSPASVAERITQPGVLLVDLRDVRERKREGFIEGAMHVPRVMLEFWIDPE